MGLSLEQAEKLGIGSEHPDHPSRKADAPKLRHVPEVNEKGAAMSAKYRNVPTVYNGVRYQSKAEAARAAELDRMVKEGLIRWWVGQPRFRLGCPENVYVADFLVVGLEGNGVWVEDVKGIETAKFQRDKKLWFRYGPTNLWIIRKGIAVEAVKPDSSQKQTD
jgi:hypothetical protein